MTMKTLGIRELTAPAIAAAGVRNELIGITNGRVLTGVLMPFSNAYVQQMVEQNITRVILNIERGEREVARKGNESATSPEWNDSSVRWKSPDARLVTIDDLDGDQEQRIDHSGMKRVALREVNGKLLEEAAVHNQPIAVTTDRVMAGVIFPVSQSWVAQLVEQNLSRVLYRISLGEKEVESQEKMTTLDDLG